MHSKENKSNQNLEKTGEEEAYYNHLLIFTIIIHIQLLNKVIYLYIFIFGTIFNFLLKNLPLRVL